jgi:hypothetical protein
MGVECDFTCRNGGRDCLKQTMTMVLEPVPMAGGSRGTLDGPHLL